jgi:hypothetical protein
VEHEQQVQQYLENQHPPKFPQKGDWAWGEDYHHQGEDDLHHPQVHQEGLIAEYK